jgi:hypothetical protein
MLRNSTFNPPDALVARAKAYAAAYGTTMTALVRAHLEAVTEDAVRHAVEDPLLAYCKGSWHVMRRFESWDCAITRHCW